MSSLYPEIQHAKSEGGGRVSIVPLLLAVVAGHKEELEAAWYPPHENTTPRTEGHAASSLTW
jgi:hypothetical protein